MRLELIDLYKNHEPFTTQSTHKYKKFFVIFSLKVHMTQNFLFYCESSLGCRVIQDFDLCKLDDL